MIAQNYVGPALLKTDMEERLVNVLGFIEEVGGDSYFQTDNGPGGTPGNWLFLPFDPMNRADLIKRYTEDLGWNLAYLEGKNPEKSMGKGWPEKGISRADKFPSGYNIGLIHCKSGTATLDIDHVAAKVALAAVGIDLDSLLKAKYKIVGDPDNPPKPIYRVPAGVNLETKQLKWPDPTGKLNGNGQPALITIFELRGG